MKGQPKVSIVIPVYNYEVFIAKCLESVINQTYQNLEVIVVDDGSTDRCPQICDEFAERDARVKVFHKQNGGIGSALQMGFEKMTGKYVAFLDSDDYMDLKSYERLVQVAEQYEADVVEFGKYMVDLDGNIRSATVLEEQVIEGNEDIMYDYLAVNTLSPLSHKFCRSELLHNTVMMNYSVGIDETISVQILSSARKLVKIKDCFYYAVGEVRKDSVSRRAIDGKNILTQIQMHNEIIQFLQQKECKYMDYYLLRYLRFLKGRYPIAYKQYREGGRKDNQLCGKICREYKRVSKELKGTRALRECSFLVKGSIWAFYHLPNCYALLLLRRSEEG